MKRLLKWALPAMIIVFALLQFTNPARTNPPLPPGGDIAATNPPPPEITALLHAACYDCHSYETKWPWYSHVAPVSWQVVSDVNDGRERLNFSDWPRALPERAAKRLDRVSEEVGYKDMPPGKYTLIHAEARLTDAQRQQLIHWAEQESEKLKASNPVKEN
jgi:Haem-binding domain